MTEGGSRHLHDGHRGRLLRRVLVLADQLRSGRRWTLHELALEHRVSARTIRRDIYALEEAGLPICHEDFEWWALRAARVTPDSAVAGTGRVEDGSVVGRSP